MDLARAIDAAWLKTKDASFEDAMREYKLVEAQYLLQAGANEFHVIETKRRVAEAIFKAAYLDEQPFDTCQTWWNEVARLGFSDFDSSCMLCCIYADCCLFHRRPDHGLRTLQPIMTKLERLLEESTMSEDSAEFYRDQTRIVRRRIDELRAQAV